MRLALSRQPYADSPNLREFLVEAFADAATEEVTIVVAWAKRSGLAPLESALAAYRSRGGRARIFLGIDQGGATRQGLDLACSMFDAAYVYHDPIAGTFHPKLYWVKRVDSARLLVGSNNLTEGGLQSNHETALVCSLDLFQPDDVDLARDVDAYLRRLIEDDGVCLRLDPELVRQLSEDQRYGIQDEDQRALRRGVPEPRAARLATPFEPEPLFGRSREPKKREPAVRRRVPRTTARPDQRRHPDQDMPVVSPRAAHRLHLPDRIVDMLQEVVAQRPYELLAFRPKSIPRSPNHTDILVILREVGQRRTLHRALESYDLAGFQHAERHELQVLYCTELHLKRRLSGGDTMTRDALLDGTKLYPGDGGSSYLGVVERWSPERAAARWVAVTEQLVTTIRTKRHQLPASHPLARYAEGELSPIGLARTAQECLVSSGFALAYLHGEEPECGVSLKRLLEMAQIPFEAAEVLRKATASEGSEEGSPTALSEACRWADAARTELAKTNARLPHLGHEAVEAQLLRARVLLTTRPEPDRKRSLQPSGE